MSAKESGKGESGGSRGDSGRGPSFFRKMGLCMEGMGKMAERCMSRKGRAQMANMSSGCCSGAKAKEFMDSLGKNKEAGDEGSGSSC